MNVSLNSAKVEINMIGEKIIHIISKPNTTMSAEEETQLAEAIKNKVFSILDEHKEQKLHILAEISEGKYSQSYSRKSRLYYNDIVSHPQIDKIAICLMGKNYLIKTAANLIINTSKLKKKYNMCNSKEKALKWLHE